MPNILNPDQQKAVDTIYGPVLVIAGAGTGKTQTIIYRVKKILETTDTPPSSILCLTYTDIAAFNMRQKLLALIGPTAYQLKIFTFHAFCNQIISDHPDKFSDTYDLQLIDDIRKVKVINQILNSGQYDYLSSRSLDSHFVIDVISQVDKLKREGIAPSDFSHILMQIKQYITDISAYKDHLKSVRATQKSFIVIDEIINSIISVPCPVVFPSVDLAPTPSVKKSIVVKFLDNLSSHLPKQIEFANVYQRYLNALSEKKLYDYSDMISFVTDRLKIDRDFLYDLQEQNQFILVDEFQDTNGSQMKILDLLTFEVDKPNIFAVGDDNQSIYRFQGASVSNIHKFVDLYRPQIIVLKSNYRSHQLILDASFDVVKKNQINLKIKNKLTSIDKQLVSNVSYDPDPVTIAVFSDPFSEISFITDTVKNLISKNPDLSIAILSRKNSDFDLLSRSFTASGLPFHLKSENDFLSRPLIVSILSIMEYLSDISRDDLLFKFLSLPPISLSPQIFFRFSKKSSFPLLTRLTKSQKTKKITRKIKLLLKKSKHLSLSDLFIKIVKKFKYYRYISQKSDKHNLLSDLSILFAYIKSFSPEDKNTALSEFIDNLCSIRQYNLNVFKSIIETESQITLSTIHSVKGIEFDYVFIYNVTENSWNSSQPDKVPLPPILSDNLSVDAEESRRLFYVALTRAKRQIYITSSTKSLTGTSRQPLSFISDIDPKRIDHTIPLSTSSFSFLENIFSQTPKNITNTLKSDFVTQILKDYRLNVSHLNSYLKCPFCFFYKNILRIPLPKSEYQLVGSVVHFCLARFFKNPRDFNLAKLIPDLKKYIDSQNLSDKKSQKILDDSLNILQKYLARKSKESFPNLFVIEQKFSILLDNIPLSGNIDLIEKLPDNSINLYDFKTGAPSNSVSKLSKSFNPESGDYFRQILFYNLLIQNSKLSQKVNKSIIEFVEENKGGIYVPSKAIDFTSDHMSQMKTLIKDTYKKIISCQFSPSITCHDADNLHSLL